MEFELTTAGKVISSFSFLLKKLQAVHQDPNLLKDDHLDLNRTIQTLALQRAFFEDTIFELLFDILSSADIAAFLKAPEDDRWREGRVVAKASNRLGACAESFWEICVYIQLNLIDIEQDAENIPNSGLVVICPVFP